MYSSGVLTLLFLFFYSEMLFSGRLVGLGFLGGCSFFLFFFWGLVLFLLFQLKLKTSSSFVGKIFIIVLEC